MEIKNLNEYSQDELLKLVLSNQVLLFQMIDNIQLHLHNHLKDESGNRPGEIFTPLHNGQETLEIFLDKFNENNREIDFYLNQS